jgi:two-component sensor histidine kinase
LTGKESMRSDKLLTSLHRISEISARTLDVARVSVWRYNQDRSAIRCEDLYELIEDRHSAGAELTVNDCPAYFQALGGCDVIAADDAQNEPRTCEFSTNYLKPLGITSMMASPIQLRGVLDGVVCHEHVGPPRKWTSDERTFVIAIANLVSLALEESERRQAEAQIKSSLKEKELLLKEVHHRVKNNLQVVSSLLNWQASYIEDASARSIFKDSQNRVRSMALIHEKLYQSDDLAHIDFGRYAQSLTASLFHSYGVDANRVRLESTIDDASLDIDKAIPCGMILNELVSNALKHAFPNGRSGEVQVELRPCAPDRLTLIVSDDGVGLPAELNIHATPSLGLQLVVTLTEQLRGNVEVNRNSGTQFQITFPVAKSKEKN